MNNKKICLIVLCISAFITFIIINQYSFALTKEKSDVLSLKVISDTKELNTENIMFKVQDNPNVSKGKFAPGCNAVSKIELDVTDVMFDFNFKLKSDTRLLSKNQKLIIKIDNKEYELGKEITFLRKDFLEKSKVEITLILVWENDNESTEDMLFLTNNNNIQIPINWEINQKI